MAVVNRGTRVPAVVALVGAGLLVAAYLLARPGDQAPTEAPPPGRAAPEPGKAGGPPTGQDAASTASRAGRFEFRPAIGDHLQYRLDFSSRLHVPARDGIPLAAALDGVESEFSLHVVDVRDGCNYVVVSIQHTRISGASAGSGPSSPLGNVTPGWAFARPPVLAVDPRGSVVAVLLDKRFRDAALVRRGYAQAALSSLGTFEYFPSLPAGSGTRVALLPGALVSFEYRLLSEQASETGEVRLSGSLSGVRKLLLPLDPPMAFDPPEGAALGRLEARLVRDLGWYSGLIEDVDFSRSAGTTPDATVRHRSTLTLVSRSRRVPDPPLRLEEDYVSMPPGEELRRTLGELLERQAEAGKTGGDGLGTVQGALARAAAIGRPEDEAALREEVRKALLADPSLVGQLDLLVTASSPGANRFLFRVLVGDERIRGLEGADAAVLAILAKSGDAALLKEALVHLQKFPTDRIVDYLLHRREADPALAAQVAASLAEIAAGFASKEDSERARHVVDVYLDRMKRGEPGFSTANSPLRQPGGVFDRYVLDHWEGSVDKREALKAVVVRAFGEADASGRFAALVESNLLLHYGESELNALLPEYSWHAGFLRHVRDKVPYPGAKTLARTLLQAAGQ